MSVSKRQTVTYNVPRTGVQRVKKPPIKYRISKGHGRLMIAVGVLFDLLPLLLIVGAAVLIFSFLGGSSSCAEFAKDLAASSGDSVAWTAAKNAWDAGGCLIKGGTATIVGGIFLGPLLYLVGSAFSAIFGALFFMFWFLAKGVNPFSFSGGRMAVNISTFIIELLPLLNTLPMITFAVWRHVKISQKIDENKSKSRLAA